MSPHARDATPTPGATIGPSTGPSTGSGRGVIRRDQVHLVAQPAMVECSASPAGSAITVVPLMDGDRVAGLEVRCGCGATTLIECVYDPKETPP